MTLFDVLTVKAKGHMAFYLKTVECGDQCDDEWDNWWQEFIIDVSWISKKKLTASQFNEVLDANQEYADHFQCEHKVSISQMIWRYKAWRCDPEDWKHYSSLKDMFEEQWKIKFPEA